MNRSMGLCVLSVPAYHTLWWCCQSKHNYKISTRFISLDGLLSNMSLEETVDYLAEELDLERSEHVREVGQSVAELRD